MSVNAKLPKASVPKLSAMQWDVRSDVLARWQPEMVHAAEADTGATISIYGAIGEDFWTGDGWTAKRLAGALRSIGAKAVEVNLNSPGGDFFEGVAMYNLLREHPAQVTVNVLGLAASAASVIAMAGDTVNMGDGAFVMIHNAWVMAIGNKVDLRAAADMIEPFDAAMAEIYAARTGQPIEAIAAMMDGETWLNAQTAIDNGFADGRLDSSLITSGDASPETRALAQVELALVKAGKPRSERRALIKSLFDGKPGAAVTVTPGADEVDPAAIAALIATLKK